MPPPETINEFIEAACVPLDQWHGGGTLERARQILQAHPYLPSASIYTAAIVGDTTVVRHWLTQQPELATAKGGSRNWDALTYLCFSRFLRLDPARSEALVQSAQVLLEHGADANTGWFEPNHQPNPGWEGVLYGAAGVAHHEAMTRLLLKHGADPNDNEVYYHTPESYDNGALRAVVETGKVRPENLAAMLLRKCDWHDVEGVKYLLQHGADPNQLTHWGKTALHNAALSDNAVGIFETLLDHGADPNIPGTHPHVHRSAAGFTAAAIAAGRGRGDVLKLFEQRGIACRLEGVNRLLAACARGDHDAVHTIVRDQPGLVAQILAHGAQLLVHFAGNGNTDGVRELLGLGVDVNTPHGHGDGYFGLAKNSTALHSAAWRGRHDTVRFLLQYGAQVNARNSAGETPLALAVRACVDSYWTSRRSPESVEALLQSGASIDGVRYPCGYEAVDALLQAHGAA